ncbi:phosphoglycerate dehydrogenase [Candidatus Woesearchaeota archaeon]|nr:phosphoglycerate dehydrogenase [Candidatus Woesearchaeota archaeon]
MQVKDKFFIIDFDSTITQVEALDELAAISLKDNPKKAEILKEIKKITDLGMEGKIPIKESIYRRVKMLNANKSHIEQLIKTLQKKITPSFLRNRHFFQSNLSRIFIISNGFTEIILPVVKKFGLSEKNVFANDFIFDERGNITGFDESNTLANENGKTEMLKSLNLDGDIYVIGDGYTDYKLSETGLVTKFFAFTENVEREIVTEKADHVIPSFDEFLYISKLPMSISYPKNRIKILLLENIHPDAIALFKKEGFSIETAAKSLDENELIEKIKNVSILGIRSKTEITKKVLENAHRLMAIGAFCIGTNQIDMNECTKKGIVAFNAPYSNTRSVVELVVGEIIMLIRNIFDKSGKMHDGIWDKSAKNSLEIRGKNIGIIGYGNIGAQLSVLAESLGMNVCYYDIVEKLALGNAKKCRTLQELLKKSDIVTVHVDGNPRNRDLIGHKEFRMMKDGVIFINLSRGFVVDIKSLASSIKSGKVKGAAIDVFPYEPKSNSEEFTSELRGLPNVILTPHIGGSTEEAQQNIGNFVAQKLIDFINTGSSYSSVNFPNIQLPQLQNAHRLMHIHENVPGVLSSINGILAKNSINIVGQHLKTNERIGYLITDVSKQYDNKVIEELKKVPNTIKFRVLY